MHQIVLQPGGTFHTHRGALSHDDLIGQPEGSVVTASSGTAYVALRPLLADFTLAMKRGADDRLPEGRGPDPRLRRRLPRRPGPRGGRGLRRAVLLAAARGRPGRRAGVLRGPRRLRRDRPRERQEIFRRGPPVVAAGHRRTVGAGGPRPVTRERVRPTLGCALTREDGRGGRAPGTSTGSSSTCSPPGRTSPARRRALIPGGLICCYVATTTQLSRVVEELRRTAGSSSPPPGRPSTAAGTSTAWRCGPDHRMIAHTGSW